MGIFSRLESSRFHADVTFQNWSPTDERWYQPIAAFAQTFAGFPIGPDTAMRVSAVFACTSLLAEVIASLPVVLYRRLSNGGREKAREHRWYKTVRRKPNRRQTRIDFFGNQQMHCGLRGNAIAEILDDGFTGELLPIHPDYVTAELGPSGLYRYQIKEPGKNPRTLLQDQVLHVRDLDWNTGLTGQSRSILAREAIAVAAAGEAFVGGFFKNDATGRLLIKSPSNMDETKRKQVREMIQENYAGWQNRSKAMLLTHGLDATELGRHDDSGFIIDPRRFQVAEIARFWRVPLFMIGLEEKSTTWGTGIEQQKQGFVDFSVKPWADRHTAAMDLALLDDDEQEEFFFDFVFDDLVRGDLLTRMQAYEIAIRSRFMNPNEARMRDNMAPYPGGDEFQSNVPGTAPSEPVKRGVPRPDEDDEDEEQARRIPMPLVQDAAARIADEEAEQVKRAQTAGTDLGARLEAHYTKRRDRVQQVIAPWCEAFGYESWVASEAAERVERTAIQSAAVESQPNDWRTHRRKEIASVLEETFIAGAAVKRAA